MKRERRAVLLLALAFLTGLLVFTPEGAVSSTVIRVIRDANVGHESGLVVWDLRKDDDSSSVGIELLGVIPSMCCVLWVELPRTLISTSMSSTLTEHLRPTVTPRLRRCSFEHRFRRA